MRIDEYKALRLRRSQLQAEIASINARLDAYDFGGPLDDPPPRQDPIKDDWVPRSAKGTVREEFYKQAERDSVRSGSYRNTDSNGNYVTPEDC